MTVLRENLINILLRHTRGGAMSMLLKGSSPRPAYPHLPHHNTHCFPEPSPAPTRRPWLLEPFAENQRGHGGHCDEVSSGQQHWEQHQGPASASAPQPMCNPETKRIEISRSAKRG